LRAARAVEEAGIPAFPIVSTGFLRQATSTAKAMGVSHVWVSEYPGVIPNDSDADFERKMREQVVPALLEGFAAPVETEVTEGAEPTPGSVVFRGTFDEVQQHFLDERWSDGLPVIPPTPERVARFLRYTSRDPEEVLGVLHHDMREATVHSVAVNGVMAGCRRTKTEKGSNVWRAGKNNEQIEYKKMRKEWKKEKKR